MFDINPATSSPIFQQIEEGILRMIALGVLEPGASVPSVRDLARTLKVNPNTVARAYQRLSERGVLAVRRGEGTFVADQPSQPRKAERNEKLREAAQQYAGAAVAVGASLDDAIDAVETSFNRVVREHRRNR
ncbi:MAG: GntR family transcriptional regulator [Thermoanaerobaculia bacterium]|nr:GntR family transcriptional regulator [Thermoanaerobaculia bacterium]